MKTAFLFAIASAFSLSAKAATLSFVDGFDTPPNTVGSAAVNFTSSSGSSGTGGSNTASSTVQNVSGNNVDRHVLTAVTSGAGNRSSVYTEAVAVTDAPGTNFKISVEFRVTTTTAITDVDTVNISLFGLSSAAGVGANGNLARYQLQYNYTNSTATGDARRGSLSIYEGSGSAFTHRATSTSVITGATNTTYTLTLTGTYATPGNPASNLTLVGEITDGVTPISVSYLDTATIPAGTFFGFRSGVNNAGGTDTANLNVEYDNFSVVPEPSSALLAGLLPLIAVSRRKR